MKAQELRKLIREEVKKVLKEKIPPNIEIIRRRSKKTPGCVSFSIARHEKRRERGVGHIGYVMRCDAR